MNAVMLEFASPEKIDFSYPGDGTALAFTVCPIHMEPSSMFGNATGQKLDAPVGLNDATAQFKTNPFGKN
jgi:hypothetical protein